MMSNVHFKSTHNKWETPQHVFDELDEEFGFTLDPCASEETAKCDKYYTKEDDGLSKDWSGETVFVNPPYSDCYDWFQKGFREAQKGTTVVMLVPARTDTRYYHYFVFPFSGSSSGDIDYPYIAGLIDGEGCIRVNKRNPTESNRLKSPTYSAVVSVRMSEKDTIEFLHNKFGGRGSITHEPYESKKDIYKWEVRRGGAYFVLESVYPFLKNKKEQAFQTLRFRKVKDEKRGTKVTEEYIEKQEYYYKLLKDLKGDGGFDYEDQNIDTEIRFIKGRLKFGDAENSAPFPSAIIVFNNE